MPHATLNKDFLKTWKAGFQISHTPRKSTAGTKTFKYNDSCLLAAHHTFIWHLWAHPVTPWPLQLYVFHVVHCRPNNFEFPNHCDMKLVTLNYGISTTQTETRPIPNPQGNADAISELFFQISGLLPGNWMLPGAVSNHPSPLCNKSELIELDTTNTLTDGRFMFIILWQTRKIKSLFTPKD